MDLQNSKSLQIRVTGIVQGVGFRPFVYKLAVGLGLKGEVYNEGSDVYIVLQGDDEGLRKFEEELINNPPPLSKIILVENETIDYRRLDNFQITKSRGEEKKNVYISPDTGICKDCEREVLDKNDRRYMYPFNNCTNCGPRFTIIKGIPYDRPLTTMAEFEMCEDCRREYTDPMNRRYHAQPTCCPVCGPNIMLINMSDGTTWYAGENTKKSEIHAKEDEKHGDNVKRNDSCDCNHRGEVLLKVSFEEIMVKTIGLVEEGKIIAVKGIGGYHLVCDGLNDDAVKLLRKRKHRDDKPFAVMMKDIDTVKYFCEINDEEERLLTSEKKPIVLLKKKPTCEGVVSEDICGINPYIGVMLPYTPVHSLLFMAKPALKVIVATSGNISSEPIAFTEDEAFQKLQNISDYYLINNRDIFIRTDDSVTRVFNNKEYLIRRARGYAPAPVFVNTAKAEPKVLALGGELKSTFCISKGREFYLSHHIGDLENAETLKSFEEGIEHYKKIFQVEPGILAYDLHPEYLSTKYAQRQTISHKFPIQHHHAHIAACMADNNLEGEVIGVAFDGTGYGTDGRIWGGEFFAGGYGGFKRMAHFDYVKLPGGEKAVKEPWRMAVSYLKSVSRAADEYFLERAGDFEASENDMAFLIKMLDKGINSPLTSSAGRLFDAAAAVIGVRDRINYEGQAAIELEQRADILYDRPFGYEFSRSLAEDGAYIIKHQQIIMEMANARENGAGISELSGRFHNTMAKLIGEVCIEISRETGLDRVMLSGGVFQNITLLDLAIKELKRCGLKPFIHERIPANDGGISLGQAVMAGFLYEKL